MHSSCKITTRRAILAIIVVILFQSNAVDGYLQDQLLQAGTELKSFQKRETRQDQEENGRNVYGRGVRMGSYLQALAYTIGFATLHDIDAKSQFSGIILAFQILIRWWFRFPTDKISIPELWIGLAQLLLFTTPGAFLLFLSFSTTRRSWKTTKGRGLLRHEVIRGEGLNFLQVFAILAWVHVTHFVFWYKIETNSDSNNIIWMTQPLESRSNGFRWFTRIHTCVIAFLVVVPYLFYLSAWFRYVENVLRHLRGLRSDATGLKRYNRIEEDDEKSGKGSKRIHKLLNWVSTKLIKKLGWVCLGVIVYVGFLIVSIEQTIIDAHLTHEQSDILHDPGQLLPLLTGGFAVVSAIVNIANGKGNLLMSKTPVRYERSVKGDTLIFTKEGEPLPQKDLDLLREQPLELQRL